jgi:outer membrane receptor for monomeric catechols
MQQTKSTIKTYHRPKFLSCGSLLASLVVLEGASAQEATPVPPVSVYGTLPTAPLMDGSAEAGYRVKDTTAAGPIWNDLPLQDAPYSISVVPNQLIDNLQAYQTEDLFKVIPQITSYIPYGNNYGNAFPEIRGFSVSQFTNNAGVTYDGLRGGVGGAFYSVRG